MRRLRTESPLQRRQGESSVTRSATLGVLPPSKVSLERSVAEFETGQMPQFLARGSRGDRGRREHECARRVDEAEGPATEAQNGATDVRPEETTAVRVQGKESAMEAELRAAKERAAIPLDVRMQRFRDMLVEKEVSAVHAATVCLNWPWFVKLQRILLSIHLHDIRIKRRE